jgi:hypothetical protein
MKETVAILFLLIVGVLLTTGAFAMLQVRDCVLLDVRIEKYSIPAELTWSENIIPKCAIQYNGINYDVYDFAKLLDLTGFEK